MARTARAASAARTGKPQPVLDVAIVGGGVSGIYSGWRLLSTKKAQQVALFEGSGRLGGRLLTLIPPGIPNARVEVGGMRFTSAHLRVAGLVQQLGLAVQDFSVYEPQNIAFIRGKRLRSQDLTDASKLPYQLLPDERDPGFLGNVTAAAAQRALRVVLGKDVPATDVTSTWLKVGATGLYEGSHLYDVTLRYLMLRAVSLEAFKLAEDSSGYDSILFTWNAADGFPWNLADYGRQVSYFHVTDGYERVPLEMARRFEEMGGAVHMRHRLAGFDQVERGGSTLIEMHFDDGSKAGRTVLARSIVLAMPRRSLELLEQRGAVLDPSHKRVHELIASVTPIPLFKMAICYPYPWWQTIAPVAVPGTGGPQMMQITQGQSVTDLPLRQCYYWAVDQATQNAVVLIYDDGQDLDFWATLRDPKASAPFEGNAPKHANPLGFSPWKDFPAPSAMVNEAHRQLVRMHGVEDRSDIPAPYAAAYRDWGEDPYGGGANFWHLHVRSDEVGAAIIQPRPPVRAYICGEAYSHGQGWVEGALETTDLVLQQGFGVQPPPWLASKPAAPARSRRRPGRT
jgi:hypothetical protein